MIQRLQRLKSKRGFTVMELVVVIAIIAIMTATIIANSSTRQSRIREATSTAKDFYTTIQTEFTRFQMFDGPLTMTLQKKYNGGPNTVVGTGNRHWGGVMWYPLVGGNYPISSDVTQMSNLHVNSDAMEWRNEALPAKAGITLEVHVVNNKILSVDWDYTTSGLFAKDLDEAGLTDEDDIKAARSELSAVLQMELDRRMEYRDGYYYARVIYSNKAPINDLPNATAAQCKAFPVTVLWAAYCREQLTDDSDTYTFRTSFVTNAGQVVGLVGGDITNPDDSSTQELGLPGTSILSVDDPSTT